MSLLHVYNNLSIYMYATWLPQELVDVVSTGGNLCICRAGSNYLLLHSCTGSYNHTRVYQTLIAPSPLLLYLFDCILSPTLSDLYMYILHTILHVYTIPGTPLSVLWPRWVAPVTHSQRSEERSISFVGQSYRLCTSPQQGDSSILASCLPPHPICIALV